MRTDTPEPLWREVVGDTEPWRLGRLFLVALGLWTLFSQCVGLVGQVLVGRVDSIIWAVVSAVLFWILFYLIWIGVHWVRWLIGGLSMFVAFAHLIWGLRDGNPIRIVEGAIGLPVAAYLALAPSVYFFALRQKEVVRWQESLVVAAVFALLLASCGAAFVGLYQYKGLREERGRAFADTAFRKIFQEGDGQFLKNHVTQRLIRERGWDRISGFIADLKERPGALEKIEPAQGRLQFRYQFPATLGSEGEMNAQGFEADGPVRLHVRIGERGGHWQIDAISWAPGRVQTPKRRN